MQAKRRFFCLATIIILNVSPAFGFILNDSFEDGDRTIQNPPESLAYFTSQEASSLKESNGVLTLIGGSNLFLMAAVGEPGEYIMLDDGEALTLEVTFRLEGRHVKDNKQFRMAWFNSSEVPGGTHLINYDAFGSKSLVHSDFRGYQAAISLWASWASAQPIVLLKRVRSSDDLLMAIHQDVGTYDALGRGGVGQVADDDLNTVQFYLRRVGQILELGAIFVPGGPSAGVATDFFCNSMDVEDPLFKFDYFVIGLNSGDKSVDRLDIESIRIFKVQ